MTDPTTTEFGEPSAGRHSVLGDLRARREQIAKTQQLRVPVPRWTDPEIIAIYEVIDHDFIRRQNIRVEKAQSKVKGQVEVEANADVLIKACSGIVAHIDGQDYSLRPGDPKGEPTRFDADLAANLGLDEGATARETIRALFFTDADILSQAQAYTEWVGYRNQEADDQIAGE